MGNILCVAADCWSSGSHLDDCPGECRGCQPHPAADGLNLCGRHTVRLSRDAFRAAELHAALGVRTAHPTPSSEPGGGHREPGLDLDPAAIEAQDAIRATLVAICRVIAEERGFTLPADDVLDLARYVHTSARWLAAHPAADEHAQDLRDIAEDPRTTRLAYPVSSDYVYLGTCPVKLTNLDGEESVCGERVRRRGDDELITCHGCGAQETIAQWWRWIVGDPTGVTDGYATAAHLSLMFNRPVDQALLRQWAARGRIARPTRTVQRDGKAVQIVLRDHDRRALYWVESAMTYARKIWGPALGDPVT